MTPALAEAKRERLADKQNRPSELLVIAPARDWVCTSCGGTGDLLTIDRPGPLCLSCANLDDLEFLPSGDARVTRCAKRSRQHAVRGRGAMEPVTQALRAPRNPRRARRDRPGEEDGLNPFGPSAARRLRLPVRGLVISAHEQPGAVTIPAAPPSRPVTREPPASARPDRF